MTTAADAVRAFITPLLPGWRVQFGRWGDGSKTDRYAVLRPVGGMPASLVRRPAFSLLLVGATDEPPASLYGRFAQLYEAARDYQGPLVMLSLDEPVYNPTNDGRPVFEVAISTIVSELDPAQQGLINGLAPQWDAWAVNTDQGVSELPVP